MIHAPGSGIARVIVFLTPAAMVLSGAPPWAVVFAIAVLVLLPTEERD